MACGTFSFQYHMQDKGKFSLDMHYDTRGSGEIALFVSSLGNRLSLLSCLYSQ
jgi:hypothetical protein